MQCYNNYYMHVAEQLAVKAFYTLKTVNFGSIYNCKQFQHYKVLDMNVSTVSSNLFSITP